MGTVPLKVMQGFLDRLSEENAALRERVAVLERVRDAAAQLSDVASIDESDDGDEEPTIMLDPWQLESLRAALDAAKEQP